jgi:hypothetical protein
MADQASERRAIVLALTAEQTARIRQATGIVVTELTIHVASGQEAQESRPFPPGPYVTFPPGPSAQAYPPGPSRT